MWQQTHNFVTQTIVALRSALAGWLTKASIPLEGNRFGSLLRTLSKKIQNKFTLILEFPDGESEELEFTKAEWDSIVAATEMYDMTLEEFVLAAIEAAVEQYK